MKNEVKIASITYTMLRETEAKESHMDMPIPEKRYEQLAQGIIPDSTAWNEIRDALFQLTRLQGYDELGVWNIELKIEIEED